MTALREVDTASSAADPFREWQRAIAALRFAEAHNAPYADIVRLSAEVIGTRNALIVDRLQAGWRPADGILAQLTADDLLLRQRDDTACVILSSAPLLNAD